MKLLTNTRAMADRVKRSRLSRLVPFVSRAEEQVAGNDMLERLSSMCLA